MEERKTTVLIKQPMEPIDHTKTIFELVGGEERVRELVDRFYDLMDLDADLSDLRAVHGPSLENARNKLFWFLCGWMGGPDHYVSQFGHPRLRMRHMPYPIGSKERDQWVACMGRAMQDVGLESALAERLLASFFNTADWMKNRDT